MFQKEPTGMPRTASVDPQDLMSRRHAAVKSFMEEAHALSARHQGDELLQALSDPLVQLGLRNDLFPREDFDVRPGTSAGLYLLWRSEDAGLSLYASAGKAGKKQPAHNHTTWAVISGVYGEEHNVFMRRTDDGSREGHGELEKVAEFVVKPGNAARLDGKIFHTIAVTSETNALHLHLYGDALDTLVGRINFESDTGGAYQRFMSVPQTFAPWVSAEAVHAMLTDGGELALLDVRETGVHTKGHVFHAASLPLSVLEIRIAQDVPNKDTRIVLVDDDDGLAVAAARRLHMRGYSNVAVMRGGHAGWRAAGFPEYSGVHVPSKAFGEVVEHHYGTPSITAEALDLLVRDSDVLVLDSRSEEEFQMMSIPGAASCPGGELVARALAHPGPVVVNCAGRTRSIMGAQSLISAGKTNVKALENGTMGQHLAGLSLNHGRSDTHTDRPVAPGASEAARRLAASIGIPVLDIDAVKALRADASRTTYLFDVRLPDAHRSGSIEGAVNAPGGQLVQQTDLYAPVRNARVVVFDTDAVQAPMTAFWLRQMGWDVSIHRASPDALTTTAATAGAAPRAFEPPSEETLVIDVGDSRRYRAQHLRGAVWTVRSRLQAALADVPGTTPLLFTCTDGRISQLAAADARELGYAARFLEGGTRSLKASELTHAEPRYLTSVDDVWYRPYDREEGVEDAMREYLSWETGLLDKVLADASVPFRYDDIQLNSRNSS